MQDFREKEASVIDIPNIGYDTFTAMMHYIYVGSVEVEQDQALPLLQVWPAGTLLWLICLKGHGVIATDVYPAPFGCILGSSRAG